MSLSDPKKINRYAAIVAVSKRARQIINGIGPVIEGEGAKPVTIAIEELEAGKLRWKHTKRE
ncbi:MAG: DNA-directed RNA polymerase subunit omega [Firmicutes bacterium]|nr:DNA-directed RNA polymerase subunit omega [Bacillota bacterium]